MDEEERKRKKREERAREAKRQRILATYDRFRGAWQALVRIKKFPTASSDEDAEELCNKIALGVLRPEGGLLYDEEVTACAKYASMVLPDLWQDREVCLQDASHRRDFFNLLGDNVDREDHPEIPEDCRTNLDLIVHICDDLVAGNRNVNETLDKLPKDTSCLRPAAEARAKDKRRHQEFKELGDEDELWHFPVKKIDRVLKKGDKLID